jgi:hypothetical protein
MIKPIETWLERHKNPTCFWLHMIGIPACFLVTPVLLCLRQWLLAIAMFVGGYMLQFLGHLIEGNRSGEELFLRRILGYQSSSSKKTD